VAAPGPPRSGPHPAPRPTNGVVGAEPRRDRSARGLRRHRRCDVLSAAAVTIPRSIGCARMPMTSDSFRLRGTSQDIIEKLNREINTGLSDPKVRKCITGLGNVPMPLSPADFRKLLIDDTEKWAK